jgi:hypothetical protein
VIPPGCDRAASRLFARSPQPVLAGQVTAPFDLSTFGFPRTVSVSDGVAHRLKWRLAQVTVGLTFSAVRGSRSWRGKKREMRKRYRVLIFAALVAALVVPVGYALSIDSRTKTTNARYEVIPATAANVVAAPVMMPHATDLVDPTSDSRMSPMSDAAKLLCVGTVLFGLAAALRKAV